MADTPATPLPVKTAGNVATGAPGTIRIGAKVYLAAQPTKADFVTLRKRLSQAWKEQYKTPLQATAQALADMPPELREIVQAGAVARATDRQHGNAAPEPADLGELITDPEVAAFWAWHLCRKADPTLTLAEVQAAVKDPAQVDQLLADLLAATSMKDVAPNSAGGTGSAS